MLTVQYLQNRIKRLEALLLSMAKAPQPPDLVTLKADITNIANSYGVNPKLVLDIIQCESGFNHLAILENTGGTIDRGICQFNDYWHAEVTDDMAFNWQQSVNAMCKIIKQRGPGDWHASQTCWGA